MLNNVLLILSLFYLFFGIAIFTNIPIKNIFLREPYEILTQKEIVISVLSGINLSIIINAINFKIDSFPGAKILFLLGVILSLSIVVFLLFNYQLNKKFILNVLLRLILFLLILLALFFKT
jgi:hypothetical protein